MQQLYSTWISEKMGAGQVYPHDPMRYVRASRTRECDAAVCPASNRGCPTVLPSLDVKTEVQFSYTRPARIVRTTSPDDVSTAKSASAPGAILPLRSLTPITRAGFRVARRTASCSLHP